MNPNILDKLEKKVNEGINSFEELDSISQQLIFLSKHDKTGKAEKLIEQIKPQWTNAFYAWYIGE
ncbi:MAG: hypothetical protein ACLFQP_00525 [Halothece sp.]